jgi:hypothetical protein
MHNNATKHLLIVVANRPRIFRELLFRALTSADRFEVLEVANEHELGRTLRGAKANWLIVTTEDDGSLPAQAQAALAAQPPLSAVAVSPDGSQLEVLTAGKEERTRQVYQNISLAELVAVLSTAPHTVVS